MDEYISRNELLKAVQSNVAEAHNERCGQLLEAILNAPTADVVPRETVEQLQKENEALTINMNAFGLAAKRLKEEKDALAREIFEELEKKVKRSIAIYLEEINKEHIKDTPLYDRCSGIIFALRNLEDFLAELKKKYTEWRFSEQISYEQPDLTDAKFIDSEGNEHGLDEQWERSDELYKKYIGEQNDDRKRDYKGS